MTVGMSIQMSDEQRSLRNKLIQLGANENTASVLLCLHCHGASTSKDLQCHCNIRQPDVSMAIAELREMNLVHFSPRTEATRGRPPTSIAFATTSNNRFNPLSIKHESEQRKSSMM